MFKRKLCFVQLLIDGDEVIAMSLSGYSHDRESVIIDYLTLKAERRGQHIGSLFMDQIKLWCQDQCLKSIIIEVEADPTPENLARIRFWERCGFQLTSYVHHYIWVPEPYQAMQAILDPSTILADGEALFRHITTFHRKAYRK
ncbi:RimJ/RimL family protein N-acetyltransferase [Paenibacillus phyllosphaerae]|uniref:RimJ/RimL family protein N-acetyltransferase n=1 Tax=Paenibacillus phyllosphaerae TaxID=274593 RepID=A0A7W5B352_9BACL|nr:GNAT family N-acetyltransferase [Paenibacillus phyllosphaerae]MBB3113572.1 RimJ/RimL family protein N-acetyltransferase [Paenibacillus phyllosphaerae]